MRETDPLPRPNLLFIMTDQQRFDTVGAYGNERIRTPNLDRLASQSTLFEHSYCTQPVCSPARSSLMTGTWPHTNGVTQLVEPLRPDIPTVGELICEGDFQKAYFGRWGVQEQQPSSHGFDVWEQFDLPPAEWLRAGGLEPLNGKNFAKPDLPGFPEHLTGASYLADRVCDFLREPRDRPFAAFASIYRPHPPYGGPFDDLYDRDEVILPDNFDAFPSADQHPRPLLEALYLRHEHHENDDTQTEAGWRDVIARYWGLCTLVDRHIGRILDALDACGQADNTTVVFLSDHGDMMGSHRLLGKNVLFEESVKVPLMIRMPGQTEARRVNTRVSQIDLLPTWLDLLGQPIPDHLQGRSIRPLLLDSPPSHEPDDVFIEWQGLNHIVSQALDIRRGGVEHLDPEDLQRDTIPDYLAERFTRDEAIAALSDTNRTVITQAGWKFNWSGLGLHELYNLSEDPGETNNLAGDPEQRERLRDLTHRIRAWQQRTEDSVSVTDS